MGQGEPRWGALEQGFGKGPAGLPKALSPFHAPTPHAGTAPITRLAGLLSWGAPWGQAAGFGIAPAPPEHQATRGRESRLRPAGGQGESVVGWSREGREGCTWVGGEAGNLETAGQLSGGSQGPAGPAWLGLRTCPARARASSPSHRGAAFPGPGLPHTLTHMVCLSQEGQVAPASYWRESSGGSRTQAPAAAPRRPRAGPGHRAGPSARTRGSGAARAWHEAREGSKAAVGWWAQQWCPGGTRQRCRPESTGSSAPHRAP